MSALISLAASAGIPIVEKILTNRVGDAAGALAGDVLGAIATQVGVGVEDLDQAATENPAAVTQAMRKVEERGPEMIALYARGIELQMAQLQAEKSEPLWMRAWRPAGMYLLGLFWLWNVIIVHVINAVGKNDLLPQMPFEQLVQISGLYMGLYMGGHTIKDAVSQWAGSK